MALPTTRNQFKEYCLRNFGKPVIDINVDDTQVEDRIDEALNKFIDSCSVNKYSMWYFSIIGNALKRGWTKASTSQYIELHHYVPKSLGGLDCHVAYLTAKEHFICHLLLMRMLTGKHKAKMVWAVMCFKGKENRYCNAFLYEVAKKSIVHSRESILKGAKTKKERGSCRGINNHMYGKRGEKSPHYGKKQTEEHKNKRINAIIGRKQTAAACEKMSLNRPKGPSGKKWFNNGIIETFGLPENKPDNFVFGRLRRAS